VYVQHVMLKEEFAFKEALFLNKGYFFIAGNAKQMPEQVKDALKRCLEETCGLKGRELQKFMDDLEADGRLQTETWS